MSIGRIFLVAGAMAIAGSAVADAATVSQREYKRGFRDCLAGRYDQDQHGASYRRGCRAAENALKNKKKRAAQECPVDVTEADLANYPGCQ